MAFSFNPTISQRHRPFLLHAESQHLNEFAVAKRTPWAKHHNLNYFEPTIFLGYHNNQSSHKYKRVQRIPKDMVRERKKIKDMVKRYEIIVYIWI